MSERREMQLLGKLVGSVNDDDAAADAELRVKLAIARSKNRGFEKHPDKPLGEVIQRKLAKRSEKGMLGACKNATV